MASNYSARTSVVAELVTAANLSDVATWCGGTVLQSEVDTPGVRVPMGTTDFANAYQGSYVVQWATGTFGVIPATIFDAVYGLA